VPNDEPKCQLSPREASAIVTQRMIQQEEREGLEFIRTLQEMRPAAQPEVDYAAPSHAPATPRTRRLAPRVRRSARLVSAAGLIGSGGSKWSRNLAGRSEQGGTSLVGNTGSAHWDTKRVAKTCTSGVRDTNPALAGPHSSGLP